MKIIKILGATICIGLSLLIFASFFIGYADLIFNHSSTLTKSIMYIFAFFVVMGILSLFAVLIDKMSDYFKHFKKK